MYTCTDRQAVYIQPWTTVQDINIQMMQSRHLIDWTNTTYTQSSVHMHKLTSLSASEWATDTQDFGIALFFTFMQANTRGMCPNGGTCRGGWVGCLSHQYMAWCMGTGHQDGCVLGKGHQDGCVLGTGHQDGCVLGTGHQDGCVLGTGHQDGCVLGTVHQDGCVLGTGHQDGCVLGTGHQDGCVLGTVHQDGCVLGTVHQDGCVLGTVHQDGCVLGTAGHQDEWVLGTVHQDGCVLGKGHQDGCVLGTVHQDGCVLGAGHQDGCLLCVFSHNCHGLTPQCTMLMWGGHKHTRFSLICETTPLG